MRLFLALLLLAFTPINAIGQVQRPPCDGDLAIVRISQIKPTSNLQTFMKAQDAHRAWYQKQGSKTRKIYSARMFVMDPQTKTLKPSETEIMSFNVFSTTEPDTPSSRDQAGWDAYVKLYRDASDLKGEYPVCLPKDR